MKNHINKRIGQTINLLPEKLFIWAKKKLIEPKKIEILNHDRISKKNVWLVRGDNKSAYLVYYDEKIDSFGLIFPAKNGNLLDMGIYGEFNEAIESV